PGQAGADADQDPALQVDDFEEARQPPILRQKPLSSPKRLREERKENGLVAALDGEAREQERMGAKLHTSDSQARECQRVTDQSHGDQHVSGHEKEPTRAVHEQEAQRSPAVAERAKVRSMG